MNGAYNFIIFMYQMAYGYHFSHSNAHITGHAVEEGVNEDMAVMWALECEKW